MKLLAVTNRYYVLLSAGLFVVGSLVLYLSVDYAVRNEVGEQLQNPARARVPRPVQH
jgi:hypothetical protein